MRAGVGLVDEVRVAVDGGCTCDTLVERERGTDSPLGGTGEPGGKGGRERREQLGGAARRTRGSAVDAVVDLDVNARAVATNA